MSMTFDADIDIDIDIDIEGEGEGWGTLGFSRFLFEYGSLIFFFEFCTKSLFLISYKFFF